MEVTTVVTGAWNAFATKITAFLPALIGAIIIFVIGWIVARLFPYRLLLWRYRLLRFYRFL